MAGRESSIDKRQIALLADTVPLLVILVYSGYDVLYLVTNAM